MCHINIIIAIFKHVELLANYNTSLNCAHIVGNSRFTNSFADSQNTCWSIQPSVYIAQIPFILYFWALHAMLNVVSMPLYMCLYIAVSNDL